MQAKMLTPERCWLFHRWHVVHDTGFTVYAECLDCESRKVTQPPTGYQPINTDWLAGLATNDRLRCWTSMRALIARRSDGQVERMEKARGLR